VRAANLALRFGLELAALAIAAYWGATTGHVVLAAVFLAVALVSGALNAVWN
jgi:uncharacterized protein DUF2568